MALQFLFGIAILVVVAYVIFRIMGNITLGIALIVAIFIASYLLVGSFPDFGNLPVLGAFIPKTGNAIAVIKDFAYNMDILGASNSSGGNLLVTVANTGKLELSEFSAYVDKQPVDILNNAASLKSGSVFVFELAWKNDFTEIAVNSNNAEAVYAKNAS